MMIDAVLPMDRTTRPGAFQRVGKRLHNGLRMHRLLFLAFTLVAAVPVIVLSTWDERSSYHYELNSVRERHLLVARNLTSTITRYVTDVKSAFSVVFESGALQTPIPGLAHLLESLNVVHVCIVAPDGTIESWMQGLRPPPPGKLDPKLLAALTTVAATPNGAPGLTNLEHDASGRPVFYLAKRLPNGRIGLGVLTTDYLISLQQAIAFGDHGHAVIVDHLGQVIAHPSKDWVAASRDISGIPVVAAMMRGETGVGQFYSQAINGMMIAGYAVAPEIGWGVMVAQPLSELRQRAGQGATLATVIAGTSFAAAAFMSWLIAFYLARPLRQVAHTAEAVLAGNEAVSVPDFSESVPVEIRQLGLAFNTMLYDLRRKNSETRLALRQAESSSLAKTQFLANMSHEIRTPLNGVVGMIELLRLSDPSAIQQRYLEAATQSSQALSRLIDDILDLSKIEAGKVELECAPFHLPSVIHDARSLFSDQARVKGLALSASIDSDLNVVLVGDAHRLLQILTNLVGNALKFTSEGGVTISVSCLEDRGTALCLRFTVTDFGHWRARQQAGVDLRCLLASRQFDHAPLRRNRAWPVDRATIVPRDGRRNRRRQRGRHRFHVLVHRGAGETAGIKGTIGRRGAQQCGVAATRASRRRHQARLGHTACVQGGTRPHRTFDHPHPAGGRQSSEHEGHAGTARSHRLPCHAGTERSRSGVSVPRRQFRSYSDGLPDAGDGWLRGCACDPPA